MLRVAAGEHLTCQTVVVASGPIDDRSDWRLMEAGELMHVSPDLEVESRIVITGPPERTAIDPLPYVP